VSLAAKERYRVLALDFGTVRIGVAVSDELRMLASARGTIPNDGQVIPSILSAIQKEQAKIVLMGLPVGLSGQETAMTTQVRKFGDRLKRKLEVLGVGFEYRDERLTSVMANANIAMSGLPKIKRQEKGLRDEEAARILLQDYLDHPTAT
jgi:putative Holliday junction resolvase